MSREIIRRMNKLFLLLVIASSPFAKGQQEAPQGAAGGHFSIKKLAIEVRHEFGTDISVMAAQNSKPKQLVVGLGPTWSPDGEKIAYCVREGRGFGQIQLINPDGSGRIQLTKLKDGACPTDWSPDGEKIAFVAYGTKTPSISVMSKNGEDVKQITAGYGARWSPDGRQLAFCRSAEARGESDSIWIVNADGTGATKVIEDNSPVLEVGWFPDGKSIVFSSERGHKGRSALFRVNVNGTGLEEVAVDKKASLYFPILSPDGAQIVADAYPIGGGEGSVILLDLASHHARDLAHGTHPSVLWEKP
jgi:Tol biopolymer transport system component